MRKRKVPPLPVDDDIVLLPFEKHPGLRGDQEFVPLWGQGYLVRRDSLDDAQRAIALNEDGSKA